MYVNATVYISLELSSEMLIVFTLNKGNYWGFTNLARFIGFEMVI